MALNRFGPLCRQEGEEHTPLSMQDIRVRRQWHDNMHRQQCLTACLLKSLIDPQRLLCGPQELIKSLVIEQSEKVNRNTEPED